MPRYVIHIGPHKTGTTYLQHAFTNLSPALAARGIMYPDQWGQEFGHHDLATKILNNEIHSLLGPFKELHHSRLDTVLLSSETFSWLDVAGIRRLRALLGDAPAIVVFYCRRWSELVPSEWGQQVRHGSSVTLPGFAFGHLVDPWASSLINFHNVLDRFAAVFGVASVRIASYNGVTDAGDDLLNHFCRHFLSWQTPPPQTLGRINDSLDMVDHEIIRALNALERTHFDASGKILTLDYLAAKAELPIQWLSDQAMQYNIESIRIDDTSPMLATLHANILAQYRGCQVEPFPAEGLFRPDCAEVKYVQQDYLMAAEVMETLRQIHGRLRHSSTSGH
jgi:hypothetical protein